MQRVNSTMTWLGNNQIFQSFAGILSKQLPGRAVQCMVWGFMMATASLSAPALCWATVNPESSSYYDEARAYLKKGDINAAAVQLKNAIRADENNVDARFDLARSTFLAVMARAPKMSSALH